jgi:cell division protein FtsW
MKRLEHRRMTVIRRRGRRAPAGRARVAPGMLGWTVPAAHLERPRTYARADQRGPLNPRRGRGDLVLLAAVGSLVALGILMVFDVTYFYGQERYGDPFRFFRMHLISIGAGTLALVVAARVRSAVYRRVALPAVALGVIGIVLVLTPAGASHGGAQRWLHVAGLSLQPSELTKLSLVLFLAWWLARQRDRIGEFKKGMLPPLLVVGAIAGLLLLEPDFGTAVLLGMVLMTMLFVAGVPARHIAPLFAVSVPALVLLVGTSAYRRVRFLSFLDPWRDPRDAGFQLVQSFITFASGGIFGRGLGESRQKMFYLPAAHTDFIFSVIGEELGLLGALAVLLVFSLLVYRGIRISLRHPDEFGRLLAFGLTALLALQALVNMAVVLGLLPTKGLALPFLSYGGSAMVVSLISAGMLYGLSRESG